MGRPIAGLLVGVLAAVACTGEKAPSLERAAEPDLGIPEVPVPDEKGPRLGAVAERVPIQDRPSRKGEVVGFLRAGATVARAQEPFATAGCPGGWYPVRPRGFVCAGTSATTDPLHPTLAAMAIQPDLQSVLPYTYGRTSRDTKWFEVDPGKSATVRALAPLRAKSGLAVVGSWTADEGGGKPVPLAMGTDGRFVPTSDVEALSPSAFEGLPLSETVTLPTAFVVKRGVRAWSLEATVPERGELLAYHARVDLTGKHRSVGSTEFWATRDSRWVRLDDVSLVRKRGEFPSLATPGQRWLDVSVVTGTLVAYEGTRPVFATLVSVGRDRLGGPGATAVTERGEFHVVAKHVTAAGRDPASFTEGIATHDVPWVLELSSGQMLIGAYWHDRFGIERSLGNVELSPRDAARMFRFAHPELPDGWHSVLAPSEGPRTLVVIRK